MTKTFYLSNPESQCYFLEILEILRREFRISKIYVVHDWPEVANDLYVLHQEKQPECIENFNEEVKAVEKAYQNIALVLCCEIKSGNAETFEKCIVDTAEKININFGKAAKHSLLSCVYSPYADNIATEWHYLVEAGVVKEYNNLPITSLDTLLWHQSFAILEDRYDTYRKKETYTEETHIQIKNCIQAILDDQVL